MPGDEETNRLRTVIEGMILATLGFLAYQTYEFRGSLGELRGKMDGTVERLDRIASVLPDVRVTIAKEQLQAPFQLAVVTTKPKEVAPAVWKSAVHIVNPEKRKRATIVFDVNGPDDHTSAQLVKGVASYSNFDSVTLANLAVWTDEVSGDQQNFNIPATVDAQGSFIIRRLSQDEVVAFEHSLSIALNGHFTVYSTKFSSGRPRDLEGELQALNIELIKAPDVRRQ